jgi:hypothetical protein
LPEIKWTKEAAREIKAYYREKLREMKHGN